MSDDKQGELTPEAIEALFAWTNFGGSEKTDIGRRGLMSECVLKRAAGYHGGHTIECICRDAGLLTRERDATKCGIQWAFNQIYKSSSPSILERLDTRTAPPDDSAVMVALRLFVEEVEVRGMGRIHPDVKSLYRSMCKALKDYDRQQSERIEG